MAHQLAKNTNLRKLYLQHDNIEEIPDNIGELTSIELLNLEHNKIEDIPKTIGKLKNLKRLNLMDNPISDKKLRKKAAKWLPKTNIIFFHRET
ncbi:MAG: hypothetical protein GY810_08935 [Aureispira sp.]|nr:hypothetical protein [Aureispira sp.]